MIKYSDKLKDPRWQKKRLEVFVRDGWKCRHCNDANSTLAIHHLRYVSGKEPWDCENSELMTLCENCHSLNHEHRQSLETALIDYLRRMCSFDELRQLFDYIEDCLEYILVEAVEHQVQCGIKIQNILDEAKSKGKKNDGEAEKAES